ncbi:MAG: CAP domain-containing protein [Steroidobacteraceae bacterium]
MRWVPPVMLLGCLMGNVLAGERPPVSTEPPAAVQQRVLELVNQARARGRACGGERFAGAPPLLVSEPLHRAARAHARDMARRGYFDHVSRDGRTPKQRVQAEGYRLRLTGENIAFGPESAAEVVAGWLGSPGHCANIMDPRFVHMGAAVAMGRKRGHFYWVQELGQPR